MTPLLIFVLIPKEVNTFMYSNDGWCVAWSEFIALEKCVWTNKCLSHDINLKQMIT